jgi:hypothetical protein
VKLSVFKSVFIFPINLRIAQKYFGEATYLRTIFQNELCLPMVLQILVRLAPLHPHIMGDAICAWFGQKTVGRMVASMKGNQ